MQKRKFISPPSIPQFTEQNGDNQKMNEIMHDAEEIPKEILGDQKEPEIDTQSMTHEQRQQLYELKALERQQHKVFDEFSQIGLDLIQIDEM